MKTVLVLLSLLASDQKLSRCQEVFVARLEINTVPDRTNMGFAGECDEHYLIAWELGDDWYVADFLPVRRRPILGPRHFVLATDLAGRRWKVWYLVLEQSWTVDERMQDDPRWRRYRDPEATVTRVFRHDAESVCDSPHVSK